MMETRGHDMSAVPLSQRRAAEFDGLGAKHVQKAGNPGEALLCEGYCISIFGSYRVIDLKLQQELFAFFWEMDFGSP